LSADGRLLLFTEAGESGGPTYAAYVRPTDGAPAVRLGDGSALALSPDAQWALVKTREPHQQLRLLPTGDGDSSALGSAPLVYHQWACWFPEGGCVAFTANPPGRLTRLYAQDVVGGGPRATSAPEGCSLWSPHAISPDGNHIACLDAEGRAFLVPANGGAPAPLEGLGEG